MASDTIVPQVLPLMEDFDGGRPAATDGWEYHSTNDGRILAAEGQLRFDDAKKDSRYSLNEATLHLDLRGLSNLELTLDHRRGRDEIHRLRGSQFTGQVNADLIAVSVDGMHWVKLANLERDFTARTFPLDAAIAQAETAAGVTDRSRVQIKFQQYDNAPWTADGRTIDNVRVIRVTQPEIEIRGNSLPIADGDPSPSFSDGTDFGVIQVGETATQVFAVHNLGVDDLYLMGDPPVQVDGADAADFRVTQPPVTVLAEGEQAPLTVEFSPSDTGLQQATIVVPSNDRDEGVYQFAVQGVGLPIPPAAQSLPYYEDFSLGKPGGDRGWEYSSTQDGRIAVVNGLLQMDDLRNDRRYSLNEAVLHLDLSGKSNIELTLDHQRGRDEIQTFRGTQFTGQTNADLIAVSVDGWNWVKLADLVQSFTGRSFLLDTAIAQAEAAAGSTDRSHVRIKFQQYDNGKWSADGRTIDNVRVVVVTRPEIEIRGNGQEILDGDTSPSASDATEFGAVAVYQSSSASYTITNRGVDPLVLTGTAPIRIEGPAATDFQITSQPDLTTLLSGQSTSFTISFQPRGSDRRQATVNVTSTDRDEGTYNFAIAGTSLQTPPVLNAEPAAGLRVRQYAPEYAGTGVYHTLYLPTDWTPGELYPVIVEYPPNRWNASGTAGTVEDTHLGYYQSGGEGFIWVTMPLIDYTVNPPRNETWYWGNGNTNDPRGQEIAAAYTKQNLIRIMEQYGGDPSRVFVTGFSRGAIATSYIALADSEMADMWLGFLPHSHHDTDSTRLNRVAGRATFITYGQKDSGSGTSVKAFNYLVGRGFPTERRIIPGLGHTDDWILEDASASSLQVRQDMRNWIDYVTAYRPGTHSIRGTVTGTAGEPLAGVRIQSGDTHWTYTDALGRYELASLINGPRTISATLGNTTVSEPITIAGFDITGRDFTLVTSAGTLAASEPIDVFSEPLGSSDAVLDYKSVYDVNQDGIVSPLDVLTLNNSINAREAAADKASSFDLVFDLNGDDSVSAGDSLALINYLNGIEDSLWPEAVDQLLGLAVG